MRFLVLLSVVLASAVLAAQSAPLLLVKTIELPDVDGRIDHLAVDRDDQRLFVAGLGNNSLEVVDIRSNAHLQSIKGLHQPQGIVVVPTPKTVVVANGQGGDVQFRAGANLAIARTVALSDDADNVRYDDKAKRVYVGYGSGALAVIDADGRRLGEIKLAGHPESFQLESNGLRIFVNVPPAGHIAVVNRETMKVDAIWPVIGAQSNFPMALDEADHRLFIGCRRPAKVLIFDTSSGKAVGSVDAVGDTDDLFYDGARKRVYVSGGEGFLDVFQLQDSDHFTRLAHIATATGARTSLFVAEQNRLYLAVPRRGGQKATIRVYEAHD
jgi:hypothetical protein